MDANILCELLSQRISPEQFQLRGLDVHWVPEDFDTPENRAIVADVIANYDTLEAEYLAARLAEQEPEYYALRRAKYPPEGDQLDEILRFLDESGMELTPGLGQIITDWKQVKVDIPKA